MADSSHDNLEELKSPVLVYSPLLPSLPVISVERPLYPDHSVRPAAAPSDPTYLIFLLILSNLAQAVYFQISVESKKQFLFFTF